MYINTNKTPKCTVLMLKTPDLTVVLILKPHSISHEETIRLILLATSTPHLKNYLYLWENLLISKLYRENQRTLQFIWGKTSHITLFVSRNIKFYTFQEKQNSFLYSSKQCKGRETVVLQRIWLQHSLNWSIISIFWGVKWKGGEFWHLL